ncbi:MAG: dihydrodipicolinate synthase family protein [Bryobacterales bacterium]|nr:dihydrodipicolinate synthase family protein [Bryobacterales bacterium]
MSQSHTLSGIYAALVTSRRQNGDGPDIAATLKIARFARESGCAGAALLGATGEYLDYSTAQRIELIEAAAAEPDLPLIVNCSHTVLQDAVRMGKAAVNAGAAAVMLMPPPFFHHNARELKSFFLAFADALAGRAPLLLYNLPAFTDWIPIELAQELLATGAYAGIKDSSGNREYFDRLMETKRASGCKVFVGNDVLYVHGHEAGADGGISGCAAAAPELMLPLRRAVLANDAARVKELSGHLARFIGWLDEFPVPVGIREALAERCLAVGPHAVPPSPEMQAKLREYHEWFTPWVEALAGRQG